MNYTTIEQSKHLIELGLNPETADMSYPMLYNRAIDGGGKRISNHAELYKPIGEDLTCWSLGALLGMMPCIPNCTILFAILDGKYGICITPLDSGLALNEIEANTPFEVVYDMIVWLLENGYIKTEKS